MPTSVAGERGFRCAMPWGTLRCRHDKSPHYSGNRRESSKFEPSVLFALGLHRAVNSAASTQSKQTRTFSLIVGLRKPIHNLHGCDSKWVTSVNVKETFQGRTVWEFVVEVFALSDTQRQPVAMPARMTWITATVGTWLCCTSRLRTRRRRRSRPLSFTGKERGRGHNRHPPLKFGHYRKPTLQALLRGLVEQFP